MTVLLFDNLAFFVLCSFYSIHNTMTLHKKSNNCARIDCLYFCLVLCEHILKFPFSMFIFFVIREKVFLLHVNGFVVT